LLVVVVIVHSEAVDVVKIQHKNEDTLSNKIIKNDRYESNEIDYTCHFLFQKVIFK
jgi:hypothetical protein